MGQCNRNHQQQEISDRRYSLMRRDRSARSQCTQDCYSTAYQLEDALPAVIVTRTFLAQRMLHWKSDSSFRAQYLRTRLEWSNRVAKNRVQRKVWVVLGIRVPRSPPCPPPDTLATSGQRRGFSSHGFRG